MNKGLDQNSNNATEVQDVPPSIHERDLTNQVQKDSHHLNQKMIESTSETAACSDGEEVPAGYILRDQQKVGGTIINNYIQSTSAVPVENNTLGLAGFVLSIVAFIFSWIPFFGGILWLVGAVLSIIGLFKAPRGFAIAGTIISFLMMIVFLFFFMGFVMLAAMNSY